MKVLIILGIILCIVFLTLSLNHLIKIKIEKIQNRNVTIEPQDNIFYYYELGNESHTFMRKLGDTEFVEVVNGR